MSKLIKYALALAIFSPKDPGQVLLVKRPENDPELPGVWGLPAASLKEDGSPQKTAKRISRDKLGCKIKPIEWLIGGTQERGGYVLDMEVWSAELACEEPLLPPSHETSEATLYTGWKWGALEELIPSAERGSLCSKLLLEYFGRKLQ